MSRIVDHVAAGAPEADDAALQRELSGQLRVVEAEVEAGTRQLASTMQQAVGRGTPLTDLGRDAATSLQRATAEAIP